MMLVSIRPCPKYKSCYVKKLLSVMLPLESPFFPFRLVNAGCLACSDRGRKSYRPKADADLGARRAPLAMKDRPLGRPRGKMTYPQVARFKLILDSKIQDSGADQTIGSVTYKFNYEVLGDSCEDSGAKPALNVRIRGHTMRPWGRYYEVFGGVMAIDRALCHQL
jgi:hypothetical protein